MKIKMLIVKYIIQSDNLKKQRHLIMFGNDKMLNTLEVNEEEWIDLLKNLTNQGMIEATKSIGDYDNLEIQYHIK